jgi:hypothetical protein
MRLYLLGIIHSDPLGRSWLRDRFREIGAAEDRDPEFVAVEWDRWALGKVVSQRPGFPDLLRGHPEFQVASTLTLDQLALSLGYEGDAHRVVFPDVPVAWLDDGRTITSEVLEFADLRCKIYLQHLRSLQRAGPVIDAGLLVGLSTAVRSQAYATTGTPPSEPDRDMKWANQVSQRLAAPMKGWAAAIVGASHTQMIEGWLRYLLETGGHPCVVRSALDESERQSAALPR